MCHFERWIYQVFFFNQLWLPIKICIPIYDLFLIAALQKIWINFTQIPKITVKIINIRSLAPTNSINMVKLAVIMLLFWSRLWYHLCSFSLTSYWSNFRKSATLSGSLFFVFLLVQSRNYDLHKRKTIKYYVGEHDSSGKLLSFLFWSIFPMLHMQLISTISSLPINIIAFKMARLLTLSRNQL